MAGDPAGNQIHSVRHFLRGLDLRVAHRAVLARDAAALRVAELGVDRLEVIADHELDAGLRRALFS
jgi:hypothetical protein